MSKVVPSSYYGSAGKEVAEKFTRARLCSRFASRVSERERVCLRGMFAHSVVAHASCGSLDVWLLVSSFGRWVEDSK